MAELAPDLRKKSDGTREVLRTAHVEALLAVEEPDEDDVAGAAPIENSPLSAYTSLMLLHASGQPPPRLLKRITHVTLTACK